MAVQRVPADAVQRLHRELGEHAKVVAQPGRRVEGEARPRHLEAGGDVAKDVVVRAAQRLRAGGLEAARDERVAHAVPRVTRYVAVAEHPRVLEAVLLHHVHLAQLPRRVEVARHKHARAVVRAAAARGEALDEPLALREELRELRAAVARRLRRRREGVAAGREGVCVRVAHPERAAVALQLEEPPQNPARPHKVHEVSGLLGVLRGDCFPARTEGGSLVQQQQPRWVCFAEGKAVKRRPLDPKHHPSGAGAKGHDERGKGCRLGTRAWERERVDVVRGQLRSRHQQKPVHDNQKRRTKGPQGIAREGRMGGRRTSVVVCRGANDRTANAVREHLLAAYKVRL
mmetsp:Transcript_24329/g.79249  ORF Transcript_24329/g.79249 Transcript_24329/m.79249 type:complete len:344 (+) Transcript_24329:391-1422(+)